MTLSAYQRELLRRLNGLPGLLSDESFEELALDEAKRRHPAGKRREPIYAEDVFAPVVTESENDVVARIYGADKTV